MCYLDESRHPSKIINERHKQRSCQHTLARQKNIQELTTKIDFIFSFWSADNFFGGLEAFSLVWKSIMETFTLAQIHWLVKNLIFFQRKLMTVGGDGTV
jgi:hypothetical protein